jgi:hypothetical protein
MNGRPKIQHSAFERQFRCASASSARNASLVLALPG